MAVNHGKAFEQKFREDWLKTFPGSFIYRLPDIQTGYKNSNNPCDFFCYVDSKLFLVECKATLEATLNFSKIPQYERLLPYKNIQGVNPGVLVWFENYDKIYWCPITEIEKIKTENKKSIKYIDLKNKVYNMIEIPSIKKRVFMESDYSNLIKKETA